MIELKNICKTYGSKQALENVNLTIPRGQIIGLFGENGAGKTTLMKSILELIPHEGKVTLDGEPVTRRNIHKLSFGTCEHSFFPGLDAKGHKSFYEDHFPSFRVNRFDGLMDFFRLPRNEKIKHFSTGQKNQFEVVMALSQGADYILLDEPFAGSDVFNRDDFYKVLLGILEPEETVILSTHLIDDVAGFISRAVLIREGMIVGDTLMEELDEQGIGLMDYIKSTYHHQPDRILNAIRKITGEEE